VAQQSGSVRAGTFKLAVTHWPYGLEVEVVEGGLLLRPVLKARLGWAKRFNRTEAREDELAEVRRLQNEFDEKGWEW
jgi:hypothetical protein